MDISSTFEEYLKEKDKIEKRIDEDISKGKSIIKEKNMTGAEVARELGISRQAVKKILHRVVTRFYKNIREIPEYKNDPKGAFFVLINPLDQNSATAADWKEVLKMLDPKDMKEIEDSMKEKPTD